MALPLTVVAAMLCPSAFVRADPVSDQATSARGVAVTTKPQGIKNLADSAIIIIGGRSTTAGALRTEFRQAAFAHLGPAVTYTRNGVGDVVVGGIPKGPKGTTFSSHVGNQSAAAGAAPGQPTANHVTGTMNSKVGGDPNYCATHAPYILHVRGKIVSGGYVVADGVCFGDAPAQIRLAGTFPGGVLALSVQAWADGSVTAGIPNVTGVYDQTVKVQVVRGTEYSNEAPAAFTAARERLPLPASLITSVACPVGWNGIATCVDGRGFRYELPSGTTGTDTWEVHAPAGWQLDSLDVRQGIGTARYAGGFDQGAPDVARWTVQWTAGVAWTTVKNTNYGFFVTNDTTQGYGSSYALTVYAVGPAGTMPP